MTENREVTLTLHGLDDYNQAVDGEVFARKFSAFMRGLCHSDIAANGKRKNKFMIEDLRKSSAVAVVRERISTRDTHPQSGAGYFVQSLNDVYADPQSARRMPHGIIKAIGDITRGAGKSFSFAEIKESPANVVRIDEYLEARVKRVMAAISSEKAPIGSQFEGLVFGSFDGILKAVDLRGDVQKAALVLSAGGKEIDCLVNALAVTQLGDALGKRVMAYGTAHYERNFGLPVRLDVREIKVIAEADNLGRWRGEFDLPFADRGRLGWDRS